MPNLRAVLKAFAGKAKKEPPSYAEMMRILSKQLLNNAEVSTLFGFGPRRIQQLIIQRKAGKLGFKKKADFFETFDVVAYARNEPSGKFRYISEFYDQHLASKKGK